MHLKSEHNKLIWVPQIRTNHDDPNKDEYETNILLYALLTTSLFHNSHQFQDHPNKCHHEMGTIHLDPTEGNHGNHPFCDSASAATTARYECPRAAIKDAVTGSSCGWSKPGPPVDTGGGRYGLWCLLDIKCYNSNLHPKCKKLLAKFKEL